MVGGVCRGSPAARANSPGVIVLDNGSSPARLLPLADNLGLPTSERLELLLLNRLKLGRGIGASYAS